MGADGVLGRVVAQSDRGETARVRALEFEDLAEVGDDQVDRARGGRADQAASRYRRNRLPFGGFGAFVHLDAAEHARVGLRVHEQIPHRPAFDGVFGINGDDIGDQRFAFLPGLPALVGSADPIFVPSGNT